MNIIKSFKDWNKADRITADYYQALKALNVECAKNRELIKEVDSLKAENNKLDMQLDEANKNLNGK